MNIKFFFVTSLILVVAGFLIYSLYQKNTYINRTIHQLDIDSPTNRGSVLAIDKPNHTGKIIVVGDIDQSVTAEVMEALKKMENNHKEIDLFLSTEGGSLALCLAICDTIQKLKVKVNTYAVGICFSGGTYILSAGTGKRFASKMSIINLHFISEDSSPPAGNFYYVLNKQIADFWRNNAKLPKNIDPLSSSIYDLSPREALRWGIVDCVY